MSGYDDDDPFGADEPATTAVSIDVNAEEELTTHFGSADEFVRTQLMSTYQRRVMSQGSVGDLRWMGLVGV
jgi:hypothetical protein